MANLHLLCSSLICSCNKEERSLRDTTIVLLEELCGWRARSGALLSNHALWLSLLLMGCELETYFGHWHANELTKCPNFPVYFHYLHRRTLRTNKKLQRYLAMQGFKYAGLLAHTHIRNSPPPPACGPGETHLWVSSFCFSNSRLLRSCSFCLSLSASMDFCFCSCCLLWISLSS